MLNSWYDTIFFIAYGGHFGFSLKKTCSAPETLWDFLQDFVIKDDHLNTFLALYYFFPSSPLNMPKIPGLRGLRMGFVGWLALASQG